MSKRRYNFRRINVLLPLLSLAGPIYFGLHNYPPIVAIEWVFA